MGKKGKGKLPAPVVKPVLPPFTFHIEDFLADTGNCCIQLYEDTDVNFKQIEIEVKISRNAETNKPQYDLVIVKSKEDLRQRGVYTPDELKPFEVIDVETGVKRVVDPARTNGRPPYALTDPATNFETFIEPPNIIHYDVPSRKRYLLNLTKFAADGKMTFKDLETKATLVVDITHRGDPVSGQPLYGDYENPPRTFLGSFQNGDLYIVMDPTTQEIEVLNYNGQPALQYEAMYDPSSNTTRVVNAQGDTLTVLDGDHPIHVLGDIEEQNEVEIQRHDYNEGYSSEDNEILRPSGVGGNKESVDDRWIRREIQQEMSISENLIKNVSGRWVHCKYDSKGNLFSVENRFKPDSDTCSRAKLVEPPLVSDNAMKQLLNEKMKGHLHRTLEQENQEVIEKLGEPHVENQFKHFSSEERAHVLEVIAKLGPHLKTQLLDLVVQTIERNKAFVDCMMKSKLETEREIVDKLMEEKQDRQNQFIYSCLNYRDERENPYDQNELKDKICNKLHRENEHVFTMLDVKLTQEDKQLVGMIRKEIVQDKQNLPSKDLYQSCKRVVFKYMSEQLEREVVTLKREICDRMKREQEEIMNQVQNQLARER